MLSVCARFEDGSRHYFLVTVLLFFLSICYLLRFTLPYFPSIYLKENNMVRTKIVILDSFTSPYVKKSFRITLHSSSVIIIFIFSKAPLPFLTFCRQTKKQHHRNIWSNHSCFALTISHLPCWERREKSWKKLFSNISHPWLVYSKNLLHFSSWLVPNGILFDAKSIGKV